MKVEFDTAFKESGVKSETYFATNMTINSLYNNKLYKIVMRIKSDYIDCTVEARITNNEFGSMIDNITAGLVDFGINTNNDQNRKLSVQVRTFNGKKITFIRYDVHSQPICCFKMTEEQIKMLTNAWSIENGRL